MPVKSQKTGTPNPSARESSMELQNSSTKSINPFNILQDMFEYGRDAWQRSILFTDILRKRGNQYYDHLKRGQPPVLIFDYDTILDAREFEKPVNFALAKIKDRRTKSSKKSRIPKERRDAFTLEQQYTDQEVKRPVVIFDPRAGHGAGIGGSKETSEIGLALSFGYDVYFVYFYIDPVPGQTLSDVKNAQVQFLEEIVRRHPNAPRPAVVGNCQGGWASAILAADRPDLVGPLLMNGAPLSYWAGIGHKNPMRYLGGMVGGVWANSFSGDLGNGLFDGASLVMNMELATFTANYWSKYYKLYSKADTEEKRFLDYEKWSSAYFRLTTDEICQIAGDLFIGNKLEENQFFLDGDNRIDLRDIDDSVLVFASEGDFIAPPQQALFWIPKIYGSVEEIKRRQQVIVYMVHPEIGHLGIFVSTAIANKEQQEMIGNIELIDFLWPGLYEMVITKTPSKNWMNDYQVRFEQREMEDILKYCDGDGDYDSFRRVSRLSELNDQVYRTFFRPLVKLFVNEQTAELSRQFHPLRVQRTFFSDKNPVFSGLENAAKTVKDNRTPVKDDNPFLQLEKNWYEFGKEWLDLAQDMRDRTQQMIFKTIYDNPMWDLFLPKKTENKQVTKERKKKLTADSRKDRERWLSLMETGNFAEGVIRMMLAIARENKVVDEKEMKEASRIIQSHEKLKGMPVSELKRTAKEQARILQTDQEKGLQSLNKLLKTSKERKEAYLLAERVAAADSPITINEKNMLDEFKRILELN